MLVHKITGILKISRGSRPIKMLIVSTMYIIIKFPYNKHSDWLKQHALSEIRKRVDGIKLASKYLLRNLDKIEPNRPFPTVGPVTDNF